MADLRKSLFEAAARRLTPLAAHIDLTYRCNFRCTHCYIPEHGGPELSTAQVFALLADLARAGTMFLVLSGGEPFLRRDLFEILAEARRLGFHVRLFTDGYFVDERAADTLASLHVGEVHVSLYATDRDAFEAITQVPGSYDRVIEGIRRLRARDIKVTLKTPVLAGAEGGVAGVLALADELGCEVRFDTSVIPQRDGCADPVVQHTLDPQTLRDLVARLASARGEKIEPYVPGSRDAWPMCGAGRSTVHIEPSGQVNPCVILPLPAGNVHERSFADIWRDSPVLQQIRGYRQRDRHGCRGCMNMGFCNFCMGRAFLSTGDPLASAAVLCNQAHARAEAFRSPTGAESPAERRSAEIAQHVRSAPTPDLAPLVQLRTPPGSAGARGPGYFSGRTESPSHARFAAGKA